MLPCTIFTENAPTQLPDHIFVDIFKHGIVYEKLALLGPKSRAEQLQQCQLASGFNAPGGASQPIAPDAINFGPLKIYKAEYWLQASACANRAVTPLATLAVRHLTEQLLLASCCRTCCPLSIFAA